MPGIPAMGKSKSKALILHDYGREGGPSREEESELSPKMSWELRSSSSDLTAVWQLHLRGTEVISTLLKAEKLARCRSGYKEQNKIGVG